MIDALKNNPEIHADRKWAKILSAKAAAKNINLDKKNSLIVAAQFLDRPLKKLTPSILDR